MITLLIDAPGLGYRSYHSLSNLSHEGSDTGIIYGFFTTILLLSEKYHTNRFVFCWDGKGSKRKELFSQYKSNRDKRTEEEREEQRKIHLQFDVLQNQVLPTAGFCNQFRQEKYEADDLVASAIINNPVKSFVVVSSDHDLLQLLQYHNCKGQHLLSSGKLMTSSSFMAEYRIPARDWATVKAIAGCPGDGVVGIPGVGEKTAIKYLLDELPKGQKRWVISESTQLICRNFKLVRLPYPGIKPLIIGKDSFNEKTVQEVFGDLGFHSFMVDKQKRRWDGFCRGEFLR
jgi:DNA polymerase-1